LERGRGISFLEILGKFEQLSGYEQKVEILSA
jgi:hypothetical protein